MTRRTLVDTGPLVAAAMQRDAHHAWATKILGGLESPLLTCEAVVTEVSFILRRTTGSADPILKLVENGYLEPMFRLADEGGRVRHLIKKYADTPMSLADACLVRMAELYDDASIVTLDSDFTVYRKHGSKPVSLIAPGR